MSKSNKNILDRMKEMPTRLALSGVVLLGGVATTGALVQIGAPNSHNVAGPHINGKGDRTLILDTKGTGEVDWMTRSAGLVAVEAYVHGPDQPPIYRSNFGTAPYTPVGSIYPGHLQGEPNAIVGNVVDKVIVKIEVPGNDPHGSWSFGSSELDTKLPQK